MIRVDLLPHPTSASSHIHALHVSLEHGPDTLTLHYHMQADMTFMHLPEPAAPVHTDGLWKHSCFELFVADGFGPGYEEYNFSPSGAWAHYRFSDYRQPDSSPAMTVRPTLRSLVDDNGLVMSVRLPALSGRIGLSAVLEDSHGQLFYWALAHPAEKPDFHHPDAFALTLK